MKINQSAGLHGIITVPGDKSISEELESFRLLGSYRITQTQDQ